MSSRPSRVKSVTEDSSRLESPATDQDNWEPSVLIPSKGSNWEADLSPYHSRLDKTVGKSKKISSPLRTAVSNSARIAKPIPTYSTPKVNTARSQKSTKSMIASTQRTTPLSMSSTQKSMNPLLDNEFGLKLSKESMEVIKADYINRHTVDGQELPDEKQAQLTTLECYSGHLETRLRDCGHYLDEMVGDRCVPIREARKALEQIVSMSIITMEELVASKECERLGTAGENDVISIHSLSNIVRMIINARQPSS